MSQWSVRKLIFSRNPVIIKMCFSSKKTYRHCLLNVRICCFSLFNVIKNCILEFWSDKRSNLVTQRRPWWTSFIIVWRFNREHNWQIHDEDSPADDNHKSTCCQKYWITLFWFGRNCQKKDEKSSIFISHLTKLTGLFSRYEVCQLIDKPVSVDYKFGLWLFWFW